MIRSCPKDRVRQKPPDFCENDNQYFIKRFEWYKSTTTKDLNNDYTKMFQKKAA